MDWHLFVYHFWSILQQLSTLLVPDTEDLIDWYMIEQAVFTKKPDSWYQAN